MTDDVSVVFTGTSKNQHRSRLRDELSSATLHLQQLHTLVDVDTLEPSDALVLDFDRALKYMENNLNDLKKKYIDKRICKLFTDTDGNDRQYSGTIRSVGWSRAEGQYLFHVEYDSDSDEEDLYHWEVKKYETLEPE